MDEIPPEDLDWENATVHEPVTDPSPIDTIREALARDDPYRTVASREVALAALTQVEQQLDVAVGTVDQLQKTAEYQEVRAVAAETALAEANERMEVMSRVGVREVDARKAAEQRANDLADALRWIDRDRGLTIIKIRQIARAALDRQEQT